MFTRNATEAINLVAQTWGLDNIREGDEVHLTNATTGRNLLKTLRVLCGIVLYRLLPCWFLCIGLLQHEG